MKPLSRALRDARLEAGLSRRTLAARSGLSASTIAAYETGQRHPRKRSLVRLAKALSQDPVVRNRLLTLAGFGDAGPAAVTSSGRTATS